MQKRTAKEPGSGRQRGAKSRVVGLDAFGNAVPEVPSARVERGRALRVVEHREVVVGPGRKGRRTVAAAPAPGLLARLFRRRAQGELLPAERPAPGPEQAVSERLELLLRRLHQEFDQREGALKEKLEALESRQAALLASRGRLRRLGAGLAAVAALTVGYGLYLLTGMHGSMTAMSGHMTTMEGHLAGMAGDTRTMSADMAAMNRSMEQLNGSVARMDGNVERMNQSVGQMSQAAVPMGQAAQAASPFMQMMRGFFPF